MTQDFTQRTRFSEHNTSSDVSAQYHIVRRHPVLVPLTLLMSAFLLCIVAMYASTVFAWAAFTGVSSNMCAFLCLLFAFVLGVVGVLTSITGILKQIDQYSLFTRASLLAFLRLKEQNYANRN